MNQIQGLLKSAAKTGRKFLSNRLFVVVVLLPTIVSSVYFGLIASDVYVSESRFVVRSPGQSSTSPLGMILKDTGFAKAQDDSYAVQDYILSRDALRAIDASLQINKAFSAKDIDPFSRFGAVDWDQSFEALYKYYEKKVTVRLDTSSSITTLTTRAFTAKDAHAINERLLELAEELVNRLNERGRQDMIRFSAAEVAQAEENAKAAALALATFRNQKGVIDPERESAIPLQEVGKIQEELIAVNAQIAQLEKFAQDNPQLPVLRQRVTVLERAMKEQGAHVAGGGRGSLAGKAADFQRLALDREFADRMLASALNTLEQARNEAQRKQIYLERIVQPQVPDESIEPRRVRSIIATLAVGLLSFGILTMLLAGIHEHLD